MPACTISCASFALTKLGGVPVSASAGVHAAPSLPTRARASKHGKRNAFTFGRGSSCPLCCQAPRHPQHCPALVLDLPLRHGRVAFTAAAAVDDSNGGTTESARSAFATCKTAIAMLYKVSYPFAICCCSSLVAFFLSSQSPFNPPVESPAVATASTAPPRDPACDVIPAVQRKGRVHCASPPASPNIVPVQKNARGQNVSTPMTIPILRILRICKHARPCPCQSMRVRKCVHTHDNTNPTHPANTQACSPMPVSKHAREQICSPHDGSGLSLSYS